MLPSVTAMAPGSNPELKVHGSALEMVGMVLIKSLLSILQYKWEVQPMACFYFYLGRGKMVIFWKPTFSLFASMCGTAVAMSDICREQRAVKSLLC